MKPYHLTSGFLESCYLKRSLASHSPDIDLADADKLTSNNLDLGNTVRISEYDTDLRWCGTLLRELADLVDNLLRRGLQPGGRSARVWDGRGRYALSV